MGKLQGWFHEKRPVLRGILQDSPSILDGFEYPGDYTTGSMGSASIHKIHIIDGKFIINKRDEYASPGQVYESRETNLDELLSSIGNFFNDGHWSLQYKLEKQKDLIKLVQERTGKNLQNDNKIR